MGLCTSHSVCTPTRDIKDHFHTLKNAMTPMYLHLYMILKHNPEDNDMIYCVDIAKQSINSTEQDILKNVDDVKTNRKLIHDMRNQLSPVFGYLDILSCDLTDKKWIDDIKHCSTQARKHMDNLGVFIRQDSLKV